MVPDEGQTIVCNIGHFDNEIDVAWLKANADGPKVEIKLRLISIP